MSRREHRLLHLYLLGMLALIVLLTVILGGFFLIRQSQFFAEEQQMLEQSSRQMAQASLNGSLDTLRSYLAQSRENAETELKADVRRMTNVAWSVVDAIYQQHHTSFSRNELLAHIRETLRPVRFFQNRGYYFINTLADRNLLAPIDPELEGTVASAIVDDQGHSIGDTLLAATQTPEQAGFTRYRWRQPQTGQMEEKIGYVRLHVPLGLVIGTGDYLERVEALLRKEALQTLARTRIDNNGYFAVLDRQGTLLLSPGNPAVTGLPLQALPPLEKAGIEAIMASSRQGGGFVEYLWPKGPGLAAEPKLSLVTNLPEWDWVLVSGVYLDDLSKQQLQRQLQQQRNQTESLTASLLILLFILLLAGCSSLLYARWIARHFYRHQNELAASQARLREQAETDQLTGLPNPLRLERQLQQWLAVPHQGRGTLALLFIDLDHFKHINDSLGHAVGDTLLLEIAARLGQLLEPQDMLCRSGGDEFLLLLRRSSSGEVADLARRLLQAGTHPCQISGHELSITLSIGIALHPNDGSDLASLRKHADSAMYHAKGLGRNNFQFFDQSMNQHSEEQLRLETQLRQALIRNELRLVYQPKVDLASGRLSGCEALLRWNNQELGEVSPARFIPVAESAGLIDQIGEWVLLEACRQAMVWQAAGLRPPRIAINVSAQQVHHCDLPTLVAACLADSGLDASQIELELTESVLAEQQLAVRETLLQLREMGVHLTMDDFGTGFSSLSYLHQFHLDTLKIDKAFVCDLAGNSDHRALTSAIIAMAQSLGLRCVAEGIETIEQWQWLLQHGCQYGQGYLFARPLSVADMTELLSQPEQPLQQPPGGFQQDL